MIKRKKIKSFFPIVLYILSLVLLFSTFFMFPFSPVLATESDSNSSYTSVIEDLGKDETFNVESYPIDIENHSLELFQVAEGQNKELFVYVYQPSAKYLATSINISTAINDSLFYQNYALELISQSDALYKYKVVDFEVKEDALRYYDISSIFRAYDETIDGSVAGDNTVSEVSYNVGKLWTAATVNGQITYTCLETETIEITDKYVGLCRYLNGFWLYSDSCDSHFVAFSTDRPIDKLMEADLLYIAEIGSGSLATGRFTVDSTEERYITLEASEVVSNEVSGLFGQKYTWNRIESAADFLAKEDLTDEAKSNLQNKQWVLRFAETAYTEYNGLYNPHYDATRVSDVTILRLKFETEGQVYNLGVVDNKQTGDFLPDNNQDWLTDILKPILYVIGLIVLVLLLIVCWPIVSVVLKFLVKGVVWLLKGLWWLITAPFSIFKDKGGK